MAPLGDSILNGEQVVENGTDGGAHGSTSDSSQSSAMEELMNGGYWDDDDEEDDEDWHPELVSATGDVEIQVKRYCLNCTAPNSIDRTHCRTCGEHKASGVLQQGHLASSLEPAEPNAGISSGAGMLYSENATKPVKQSMRKRTAVGFDDRMLNHFEVTKVTPHPERPDRVRAILAGFTAAGLYPGGCVTLPSREITRAELEAVHEHEHVNLVEATGKLEASYFSRDTYANQHSALAARLAAGISADLASAILTGQIDNGFALVRPPGHHADHGHAMGFCLHNNACLAAKAAQAAGAKKVLIVDWDVHHGNGTQDIFDQDPSVLYISLHRYEGGSFYPRTGAASEVGSGPGEGFSVNIPWPCGGIGDNDYLYSFIHVVLPIAKHFGPDITIVSAGFDAAKGDPLGGCEVSPTGYAQMTHLLESIAGGKLLVVLEGGYNLRSISASATAILKVLQGEPPESVPESLQPSEHGVCTLLQVLSVQRRYWREALKHLALHLDQFSYLAKKQEERKSMINVAKKQMERSKKGSIYKIVKRRRYRGGPVWWKWGRRRLVYSHWFANI